MIKLPVLYIQYFHSGTDIYCKYTASKWMKEYLWEQVFSKQQVVKNIFFSTECDFKLYLLKIRKKWSVNSLFGV